MVVATVVVFTFLASWNEFLAASIFLRDSDESTLAVPAIMLFLALQRFYIRGLTQGRSRADAPVVPVPHRPPILTTTGSRTT